MGAQLRGEGGGSTRQALDGHTVLLAGEVEVIHHVGRNAVQMTVIDLKAGDDESHAFGAKGDALCDPDLPRHFKNVGVECWRQVGPVVVGFAWHDEGVTGAYRGDGHEDDAVVIAQSEVAW